jgi:hypothetical protein
MDAEDVHRLLTRTQLRCLLLEADKDAEISRADKYRKILGSLTGEDGATQPQVAGIFHMSRSALVCPRVATFVVALLSLGDGCPSANIISNGGSSRLSNSPVPLGPSPSSRQKPPSK